MAVDHIQPTSSDNILSPLQVQTESRRNLLHMPPSSTSTHTTSTSSLKPQHLQRQPPTSITTTSAPPKKPLVFKKPTKHQFTWSELSKMVASKDLTPMGRSEDVQEAYQRAIKRRTRIYGSPDEYIRQRVLHWPPADKEDSSSSSSLSPPPSPWSASSDGNESPTSYSSISPPSSPTGPVDPLEIRLAKNEFPYSVKPGIEHWLIWSQHPLTDEVWIRRYLEERLPGRDFLFFINPPELRSVPSISHVQVFTKGEGEVLDEEDIEIKQEEKDAQC
ncbi:hypothetical protein BG011_008206 [Mortierella polycephala]|uniref:Uncharacterized protein n=1 Tax=Mortierella polycephala TaxID=41804 RepID=A0A9P6PRJ3_9FUNG|nr:hypothetical protein BG011_008206 [Mortierella polycephala]